VAAVRQALYRAVRDRALPDELEMLTNSEVEIDGDAARVTSIRVVLGGEARDPRVVAGDRVVDELSRGPDGSWVVGRRSVLESAP
jgi:hypothetical protein